MSDDLVTRLCSVADCDARAGEPLGKCMREAAAEITRLKAENAALKAERDTPAVADFASAAQLEAWHQRNRWGSSHDAGKSPFDWFWLIGYLAQKAASAAVAGDNDKALHHTISTAAALANWHLALSGGDNRMRPGIEPPTDAALATNQQGEGRP